jgi:hypothetical protein
MFQTIIAKIRSLPKWVVIVSIVAVFGAAIGGVFLIAKRDSPQNVPSPTGTTPGANYSPRGNTTPNDTSEEPQKPEDKPSASSSQSHTSQPSDTSSTPTGGASATTPTPTPTQTPTPDNPAPAVALLGWQLNASNTGLAPKGLNCNSLPVYSGGSKPAAGTVITEKRITTPLNLSNGNITIDRSCIKPTSVIGQGLVTSVDYDACGSSCPPGVGQVTIRDSEFDGSAMSAQDVAYSCAFLGVGILQRNYMHHMGSGICFYNTGHQLSGSAEGNFVHNLRAYGDPAGSGSHNSALTVRDFPTNTNPNRRLTILNNRLDVSTGNDTGAAFIQTYGDNIDHVTFDGNLFEGNGYQLILEAGFGNSYGHNMRANNNRFSGTGYGPGYVDDKGLGYGWAEFTNNYRNDPAQTNNQGTAVNL